MSEDATIEVKEDSANVYVDLGRPNADEMLLKAQLASRIGEAIRRCKLTQSAAAEITGLPQPKLSGLLRGQFRGVSEAKMLHCLTRLGRDVRIVIGPARRLASPGRIEVTSGEDRAPTRFATGTTLLCHSKGDARTKG